MSPPILSARWAPGRKYIRIGTSLIPLDLLIKNKKKKLKKYFWYGSFFICVLLMGRSLSIVMCS